MEAMLEGNLKNLPFNDLVQVLANGQKTGVLTLTKDAVRAYLFLERGRLVRAHVSSGLHLGELLVKMDVLTTFEVQTLLTQQSGIDADTPFGTLAIRAGYLDAADLNRALRKQTVAVLTELAGWRSGSFTFGERPPDMSQKNEHSFDTLMLLMEVLGRLELWQQGSAPPNSVFERAGDPTRAELSQSSWEVLGYVDGRRSARSIAAELDLPEGEVFHLLHELQSAGVVAPTRFPSAALLALVLSPNQGLQRLIALNLQRADLATHSAETAAAGLEYVRGQHPHVIVVEDQGGEGWEFVRSLRALPGRSHLPVVVLCAQVPRGGLFNRFKRPRAHVLQKPFHELELQQLVTRVTGRPLAT